VTEPPVTEPPTEPPVTEPPVTEPPTEPPVTEPPVTEPPCPTDVVDIQGQGGGEGTDPCASPTFSQSEAGETDLPSEPDTTTISGSDETAAPSNGAWLLVVALGMLLASIVVLTPVRARSRR
jgi:hypothetical protein